MKEILKETKKYFWPYVFVFPMAVLFVIFTIYPLLSSVRYTFYNWNGIGNPKDFVGFKHYISIIKDLLFWNAFKNTFFYAGIVVPTQLIIALTLAVVLNSRSLRLKGLFRLMFFLPIITSPAVVGIVFSMFILSIGGTINHMLQSNNWIGRPVDWLGNPHTAMWIIIAVGIWLGLGYPLIYFLAGLQSINQELYDAAKVDGAGTIALLWYITIPSIRPVGMIVLLLSILYNLRVFDTVQVMTRGGPYFVTDVVGTYIYRYAFATTTLGDVESNLGFAAAAAFFMGVLVMFISVVQVLVARRLTTWRQILEQ